MGTSQSVVARLESARRKPTFDVVARYAAAIDRRIDIHLVPAGSGREVLALASGQSGDGDAACFNPPEPAVSLRPLVCYTAARRPGASATLEMHHGTFHT